MNDLDPEHIAGNLVTRWLGRRYEFLPQCGSTNDVAADLGRSGAPDGTVVVADAQSGGRGRIGRAWHSPPGTNLYLSVLLRPACAPSDLPPFTLLVGAVLAETIDEVLPAAAARPRVKWPNDVLLVSDAGARKLAGILVEMASQNEGGNARVRQLVIGIGVNVNLEALPADLTGRGTSLRLASGIHFDRGLLLCRLLAKFEPAYEDFLAHGRAQAIARFRQRAWLGQTCTVAGGRADGGDLTGVAVDVDGDGALLVRGADGRLHRVVSGEAVVS